MTNPLREVADKMITAGEDEPVTLEQVAAVDEFMQNIRRVALDQLENGNGNVMTSLAAISVSILAQNMCRDMRAVLTPTPDHV